MKTVPTSASRGGGTVTEKGIEYTVEEGDSLWGIASKFKEYGVTVDAIRRANNMGSASDRIVPGQKLFIPVKE
ncbi:LysM peptidoglycan-binding domain-containing protein [bacterium]|nr:LysM peptidoglycan-binding domain-containing protein [bacterium]